MTVYSGYFRKTTQLQKLKLSSQSSTEAWIQKQSLIYCDDQNRANPLPLNRTFFILITSSGIDSGANKCIVLPNP